MPAQPPRLNLDPTTLDALERAASDQGVSVDTWLADLIAGELRTKGYLGVTEDDGLRPEQLNADNDG